MNEPKIYNAGYESIRPQIVDKTKLKGGNIQNMWYIYIPERECTIFFKKREDKHWIQKKYLKHFGLPKDTKVVFDFNYNIIFEGFNN